MGEHSETQRADPAKGPGSARLLSDSLKFANDWVWPASDQIAFGDIHRGLSFLRRAFLLCNPVGCAIQAGGNAGIHPIVLSDYFERVYTWEPEPINFAAMTENLARRQIANVVPINGALGREEGRCGLNIWPPNRGAVSTTMGDEVTVEPLDPWNLEPVRFIQLDVEGDELDVLAGAKELIKRYAPYIMLEVRGHKVSRGTVDRYMKGLDYIEVDRSDSDVLYASL